MSVNTMRSLIEQLGQNRDTIKDKLVEMGLEVAEAGKYSDVAATAKSIYVDPNTTEIPLSAGQTYILTPGNYFANEVEITAGANEIDNKYYAGTAKETISGTATTSYTASTVTDANGNSTVMGTINDVVISVPDGYVIAEDPVTASAESVGMQPITNLTATPAVSDDGKTLTIAVNGTFNGPSSGTINVTYSMTCVAGTDYTGGTAVTPSTEEQSYCASEGKVMTAFTVAAIQTEEKEIAKGDVIGTSAGTVEVTPTDGSYLTKVTVNKVVINSATLEDATGEATSTIVVKASDYGCDGLNEVTIPVEDLTQSIDLCDLVIADSAGEAEDYTLDICEGYKSGSTLTLETAALYNALAAL